MNGNTELLNYIYQNSNMGVDTIRQLKEMVDDKEFLIYLDDQLGEYNKIGEEALKLLNESGHEEKDISAMAKVATYMSIGMKTLMDKSSGHIAEMMMQGSTMGIIEASRNVKRYSDADSSILSLAKKLLKTEEHNFEQLKKFL